MGGLAILHPQDCLKDQRVNLFSTPVKSRRAPKPNPNPNFSNSSPNFTRSEGRKRSPPTGVRKHKSTAAMVADTPAVAVAKNLVMGQVKILKRGEALDESSSSSSLMVLKDLNDRKVANATATVSPVKDLQADRKVVRDSTVDRRVLSAKKKAEKKNSNSKIEDLKIDDFALSSTNRLGPDPELVPKQMKADLFFAGSAFVDSPPPSSLPLPGFFTKNLIQDPTTDLRRILGLNLS